MSTDQNAEVEDSIRCMYVAVLSGSKDTGTCRSVLCIALVQNVGISYTAF